MIAKPGGKKHIKYAKDGFIDSDHKTQFAIVTTTASEKARAEEERGQKRQQVN
jgi:hypothetical protein